MSRSAFVLLHRWVGLAIALFLVVAGLTGAVIAWNDVLDDWLNPRLHRVASTGPALPPLELARRIEARDPHAWVTSVPMQADSGRTLDFGVEARIDPATGQAYPLAYDEVFVDPVTGEEAGRRQFGQVWPITRETLLPFLYVLHYSLQVPGPWGAWLMGGVAVLWTFDCFVGLVLTLPRRRAAGGRSWVTRWRPAWKVKRHGSAFRVTFDLHRAASLWTWGVLLVLAVSAFAMNLDREVFRPLVSLVSPLTPTPYDSPRPSPPAPPGITMAQALDRARTEAAGLGWTEPVGQITYRPSLGFYDIRFYAPGGEQGEAGAGPRAICLDGNTGAVLGTRQPWHGTAGDLVEQVQYPLHSGRILGLAGRIAISLVGIVVAGLSITGVLVWWRKQAARSVHRYRQVRRLGTGRPAR